jgi:hypothetical protein
MEIEMTPDEVKKLVEDAVCEEVGLEAYRAAFKEDLPILTIEQIEMLGRYVIRERSRKYNEGLTRALDKHNT